MIRTAAAKVTVELRRGSGDEAMLDALREAVAHMEAALRTDGQQAP